MRRRQFITLVGSVAIAWPLTTQAQQPKVWRIGFLAAVPPTPVMLSAFRDGLRGRGYVEGQNLSIDVRWPQGPFDQDPSVVAELVNSNVDVIVAWATPATIAAHHATSTIPIVMAPVGDPVEFDRAFAQLSAKSVDGVVVLADPTVIEHSRRIAELAQSVRLP